MSPGGRSTVTVHLLCEEDTQLTQAAARAATQRGHLVHGDNALLAALCLLGAQRPAAHDDLRVMRSAAAAGAALQCEAWAP